ncbi:hypothetical protein BKP37_01635 [Anaerobacillus alkalilacustris]|uniref:Uncharacterized protein n=1 Tax=Anaerobacillus alkalilacustris TaxID=393763 RepID=A0A1S2LXJ5_9BACI|nr:hypothetical protein [Anaerobacillus alkalilacustris]OIJ17232.1 hypothetical protein BKP37_01635 [Anaerobacillus alkalilacustris]
MKMLLFLVHLLIISSLFLLGIINLFMFQNGFLGVLSILTGLLMIVLLKNATDDREIFGR